MQIKSKTLAFVTGNPIETRMLYDTERPAEVTFVFDSVEWLFARELIRRGVDNVTGDGDITVYPGEEEGTVMVHLESPYGTAEMLMSQSDIIDFLERTYAAVNEGQEEEIISKALETWVSKEFGKDLL